MTESELLAAARSLADQFGWARYHTHDSRRSEAGFPDLVLGKEDRGIIFAELKAKRGRLSQQQERWLWLLEGEGYETKVVWACDDACHHPKVVGDPDGTTCGMAWLAWRLGPNGRRTRDVGEMVG